MTIESLCKERSYEDIVDLSGPEELIRPRMSRNERAAQFAPFSALSGHQEAIRETARRSQADGREDF